MPSYVFPEEEVPPPVGRELLDGVLLGGVLLEEVPLDGALLDGILLGDVLLEGVLPDCVPLPNDWVSPPED